MSLANRGSSCLLERFFFVFQPGISVGQVTAKLSGIDWHDGIGRRLNERDRALEGRRGIVFTPRAFLALTKKRYRSRVAKWATRTFRPGELPRQNPGRDKIV